MALIHSKGATYLRLLLVALAFAVMIVASTLYVNNMLRRHLQTDAMDLLTQTKLKIEAELVEPETTLAAVAETIRQLIEDGADAGNVQKYMQGIAMELQNKSNGFIFDGLYGYFSIFGNIFLHTSDEAIPANYDHTQRPWYKTAMEAGTATAVSPIYIDFRGTRYIITYVRNIFDEDGRALGVICLNVPLDHIINYVADMRLTTGSYSVLHDENLNIFYHPNPSLIGRNSAEAPGGIALFSREVLAGGDLFERESSNYQGDLSVLFSTRLNNGWLLYAVTPKAEYYQESYDMGLMLSILGMILAIALGSVLLRIDYAKNKSDEQYRRKSALLAEVEQRDKLLNTVNQSAVMLLGSEEADLTGPVLKVMDLMGRCVDVDRVQIWQNEMIDGTLQFVMRYECLSDIGRQKTKVPNGLHFPYSSKPEWEQMFLRGECINSPLSALPPEDQAFLINFDIQSIVLIPLFLRDHFWGFFSLVDCHNERTFSEDEIKILRSGGLLIANAFLRNEMTHNIRTSAEQLEAALGEAQEANKAKSKFLATMSHEIRTPMNVILGVAESQLLSEGITPDTKEALEKIYSSGSLLLNIINDILDLSKIEAGKFELVPASYHVSSLINDAANLNLMRFGEKPIDFKLIVDENIPQHLFGDELRIKQILNNLLSNAFKYTSKGTIVLSFSVEIPEDEHKTVLIIVVSDTGQGMTQEQVQKLFDEYSRFNMEANRTTVGTGLGMAITRNLISLMNGQLLVDSTLGKGTTITVRIPQEITGPGIVGRESAQKLQNLNYKDTSLERQRKIIRVLMPYGTVLVVDDMKSNLDVAKLLMKPYELNIDTAESGYEAVDLIKGGNKYDIVFMDHMMPNMDGIEAVKELRAMGYTQTIVALTANAVTGQQEMFLSNGFDGYVSKPIDMRQLNDILNKFIRDRKQDTTEAESNPGLSAADQPPPDQMSEGGPTTIVIPGVDTEAGLALYDNDIDIYITVLQSFADNAPAVIEQLRMVTAESLPEYAVNVHGLKGISANIGAKTLQEAAFHLETAAKSGDLTTVLAGNEAFLSEAASVVSAVRERLEKMEKE